MSARQYCSEHPRLESYADRAVLAAAMALAEGALRMMAEKGGGPGNACVVLTDRRNVGWFFASGAAPLAPEDAALPADHPITLARRLDALLPRVHAACPACARALLGTPRTHLPVYLRVGPTGEAFTGEMFFPEDLYDVAHAAQAAIRARRS